MQRRIGGPSEEELLNLAWDVGSKWKNLGRVLGIPDPKLDMIDEDERKLMEKTYSMLRTWKQGLGAAATYEALEMGLRHVVVLRADLAEKYCYCPAALPVRGPIAQEHEPMS